MTLHRLCCSWVVAVLAVWLLAVAPQALGFETLRILLDSKTANQQPVALDPSLIRAGTMTLNLDLDAAQSYFADAGSQRIVPASQQTASSTVLVAADEENSAVSVLVSTGAIKFTLSNGATARQLRLHVSGPAFYAYEDSGAVRLIFLRGAFQAPVVATNVPFTVSVQWFREETPLQLPTRATLAGTALGTLLVAFAVRDTHLGVGSVTRLAVIERFIECNHDLGFVLHPTQVTVGEGDADAEYGAIMMGFGVLIAVALLHTLFLRHIPKFIPYFPGDYWLLCVGLICPISVSCMQTLFLVETPMRWALAGIVLLMFYLLILGFYLLSYDPINVRYSTQRRRWEHRTDPTFVSRWTLFYTPFKPNRRIAFFAEVIVSIVLCGFSAAEMSEVGPRGCNIKSIAALSLVGCEILLLIVSRPYIDWFDLRLAAWYRLVEAAALATAVANAQQTVPDSTPVLSGQIILMSGSGIIFLKSLIVMLLSIAGKRSVPSRMALALPAPEDELQPTRPARPKPAVPQATRTPKRPLPGAASDGPSSIKRSDQEQSSSAITMAELEAAFAAAASPNVGIARALPQFTEEHHPNQGAGKAFDLAAKEVANPSAAQSASRRGSEDVFAGIPYTYSVTIPDKDEFAAQHQAQQDAAAARNEGTPPAPANLAPVAAVPPQRSQPNAVVNTTAVPLLEVPGRRADPAPHIQLDFTAPPPPGSPRGNSGSPMRLPSRLRRVTDAPAAARSFVTHPHLEDDPSLYPPEFHLL